MSVFTGFPTTSHATGSGCWTSTSLCSGCKLSGGVSSGGDGDASESCVTQAASLLERRKLAAEASLGMSAHAILNAVSSIASERGLGGSLLDFGAGQGDFIRLVREATVGFSRITGVDIAPRPRELPSQRGMDFR